MSINIRDKSRRIQFLSGFFGLIIMISPLLGGLSVLTDNYNSIGQRENEMKAQTFLTILKELHINITFSDLTIETHGTAIAIRVPESNFNMIRADYPVLPAFITTYELPFGSIIHNVVYSPSTPEIIPIYGVLPKGRYQYDTLLKEQIRPQDTEGQLTDIYPDDWGSFHTGGGLSNNEHVTFFTLRMYPVRYDRDAQELLFVRNVTVTVTYEEPQIPILNYNDVYDLLIIAPENFIQPLAPLVTHKNDYGVKTKLVSVQNINDEMFWHGRDIQEKIKYFIKNSIETWGISHVLLVGGLDGQADRWNLPVRYSNVVPPDEQEYAEQSFLSDLYYADIYDANGSFSSWDSNDDDQFAVWNEQYQDEMDIYPDVYLGRLPCRTISEVHIMVDKIINYETNTNVNDWFFNYVIVAGDSYPDESGFNEGELIGERSVQFMQEFNPLRVYASLSDIDRKTVNDALHQGAGFAYFCGHGSPASWSTHFPPDGMNWTTGYNLQDMVPLHNEEKLPVTIVGGCHNGQFDVGLINIFKGIKEYGFMQYFFRSPYRFYYNEWVPNCWAWWLTSKPNGGAIATIANTGLGTHGEEDQDYNGVADYLEVLDGWLELRFLQLFGEDHQDDLGKNHAQTMTEYLHVFVGNDEKMDTKMVQQWVLFGDPSLKIGGYFLSGQ
ncbi:MAG: C25 family cysteine peptidase [Thermoplasmatota archaeon]